MCQVDPFDEKYSKVEYIVVDPSCSGSGITTRMDRLVDEEQETAEEKVHTQLYLSVTHNVLANVLAKTEVFHSVKCNVANVTEQCSGVFQSYIG